MRSLRIIYRCMAYVGLSKKNISPTILAAELSYIPTSRSRNASTQATDLFPCYQENKPHNFPSSHRPLPADFTTDWAMAGLLTCPRSYRLPNLLVSDFLAKPSHLHFTEECWNSQQRELLENLTPFPFNLTRARQDKNLLHVQRYVKKK